MRVFNLKLNAWRIVALIAFTTLAIATGEAASSGTTPMASSVFALSSRYLLPAVLLPAELAHPGVVLLSAQSELEVSQPGFVNNAIPVDVDALTILSESAGAFTDFAAWAQIFGALGISTYSEVIVYDDGEMKFASRVRFLLFYFGVRRTFIVNGGYSALQPMIAEGRLIVTSPGVPTTSPFDVKVRNKPIRLVDSQDVLAVLGNPFVTLLDVRTVAEYDGCVLLPGVTRGGHIPGARNLPIEKLLTAQASDSEFSFLDLPAQLRRIFLNFALRPNDRIIVYCHDGAKSSLAATALIDAGYKNVSLYYLSYLDWQSDPNNPVESISPCN